MSIIGSIASMVALYAAGEYVQSAIAGPDVDPLEELNARQANETKRFKSNERRKMERESRLAKSQQALQSGTVRDLAMLGAGDLDEQIGIRRPYQGDRYSPEMMDELAAKLDPVNVLGPYGFMKEAGRRAGLTR